MIPKPFCRLPSCSLLSSSGRGNKSVAHGTITESLLYRRPHSVQECRRDNFMQAVGFWCWCMHIQATYFGLTTPPSSALRTGIAFHKFEHSNEKCLTRKLDRILKVM